MLRRLNTSARLTTPCIKRKTGVWRSSYLNSGYFLDTTWSLCRRTLLLDRFWSSEWTRPTVAFKAGGMCSRLQASAVGVPGMDLTENGTTPNLLRRSQE